MLVGEDQTADSGVRLNPALGPGEQLLKRTLANDDNNNNDLNYQMDQLQNYQHQNQSNLQAASAIGPSLASFTGWEWLLIALLISIILISIIGNCLVCVAIFTDRRLRKLGNAFIVSLAIADLFVSCLVMTFALCNDLMNYWMFGEWFCDIWISFDIMCSTASILNLCAISLDRFIHIKDCLLYNQLMTKRVAISAVIIIWIISALVSFVPINLGWHKPNHFKQPVGNITGPDGSQQHLNLVAASLNNEPQVSLMAHEMDSSETTPSSADQLADQLESNDQNDDGALNSENRKLALIGHNDVEHAGQRAEDARGSTGRHAAERHKRHANVKHSIIETTSANHHHHHVQLHWPHPSGAACNELGEKISEIRRQTRRAGCKLQQEGERSQIANELRQASSSWAGRRKECDGGVPQSLIAPDTAGDEVGLISKRNQQSASLRQRLGRDAAPLSLASPSPQQPVGKLKQLANLETHLDGAKLAAAAAVATADATAQVQSNSLRCADGQQCGRRSGSGSSWTQGRQSNDYDESKQSLLGQAHELHKNELSDQVAVSPAGEFNRETRPKAAAHHNNKQRAGQEPLEQIKHSQSNPSSGPVGPEAMQLALNFDKRTERASGDQFVSKTVAEHSTGTKSTALKADGEGQIDQAKVFKDDHLNLVNVSKKRRRARRWAKELEKANNSQQRGQSSDSSRQQTRDAIGQQQSRRTTTSIAPPAGPTPNELPQCMLTLTPTYAVISSTISFYIPCIIMLGLYSKLFACARRHVRNIKAISKAPQPIGFGSPVESPIGAPPARGPATNAVVESCGVPNETANCGPDGGEIINGRRANAMANASNIQDQAASSWPSSQTVANATTTAANNNNNNNATGSQSLSSQCRAKLARLVRRPEPKLADRSRTWIKFGRQPSAVTLKPQVGVGAKSTAAAAATEAESTLSTSPKVPPAHVHDATDEANLQKTTQSACSPLLMKLNNQNAQQTSSLPMTTIICKKIDMADYNDGGGIELVDAENKKIARGNEMEPFLSGHDDCQPETERRQRTELGPMNGPQAVASLGDDEGPGEEVVVSEESNRMLCNVTNPSRPGAIGAQSEQILSANYTPIRSTPLKSSINSNHNFNHHHHQRHHSASSRKQNQQQQSKQQTNQLATHKAAITLGIIMGTFLFCWVPFFCLNIIKAYHGDSIPASLFRAFTWLGYANSALNPIIYGIHNSEFRNAFNRIFFKHLTLKNGRQYLNRRFSYDLRPHDNQDNNMNHHQNRQQLQFRWRFNNANQQNQHQHNQCFETRQQHQPSQLQQNSSQQPVSTPTPTPTTLTGERDVTFSQTHHQASGVVTSSQHHHYQLEI